MEDGGSQERLPISEADRRPIGTVAAPLGNVGRAAKSRPVQRCPHRPETIRSGRHRLAETPKFRVARQPHPERQPSLPGQQDLARTLVESVQEAGRRNMSDPCEQMIFSWIGMLR